MLRRQRYLSREVRDGYTAQRLRCYYVAAIDIILWRCAADYAIFSPRHMLILRLRPPAITRCITPAITPLRDDDDDTS